MAEALARQHFETSGLPVEVRSAGVGALQGYPADPKALMLMEQRGIDLSAHRAVQVDATMTTWADLILVMEETHRQTLRLQLPASSGKVLRLGHWIDQDIPDPYRRNLAAFETALGLIERSLGTWLSRL
ncbi:MAG: hypothetical protein C1943_14440 [Halochromatium sp.]|nr:hypothetical protein [Halochromatium sp.]